ncbi:MAG: glutamine-hydrolyzing carbamoyl-phosphate synthase small subunit [Rhodospirillaceae bacterium]|nr:glutamine-hydrolyzing carbamoyl-phosphate synthase small subunit [Rhodospirillaceae bacterium]
MSSSPTKPAQGRGKTRTRGESLQTNDANSIPAGATAALVLADGEVYWGFGAGALGTATGEICFNTSMTGYQEILTDPSYAGQIITFTFPHIGNTGANGQDIETATPAERPHACGLILRAPITPAANFRATNELNDWLRDNGLIAVTGIDTRRLTRRLREKGAINGAVCHALDGKFDITVLRAQAADAPAMAGLDLALTVTCEKPYEWTQTRWQIDTGYGELDKPRFHVVAMDFGAKSNILRCLADLGCRVTVVPATTSAKDILGLNPDGIFLSNGPGDPAATGDYAVPAIKELVASGKPLFGICLGHQILALTLGAKTVKMHHGHRGANHPVKDLATGKVEITSQNHGFVVDGETLPEGVTATHVSLFDQTLEGLSVDGKPVFSVQHHPEASPGPQDSHYLFQRFVDLMEGENA